MNERELRKVLASGETERVEFKENPWITSHGGLPEGITLEELTKPHKSHPRNPLLVKVFYLAGLIEQYGSGTVRMAEWMKEAGLPEPEYKEEMGGFSVYFYKDIYTEENLRKIELSERQIKAVMYVKERGKIANKEYQKLNAVSNKTAYLELSDIVEKGILITEGSGRAIAYVLKVMKR